LDEGLDVHVAPVPESSLKVLIQERRESAR
jgi:hypothetical protein